MEPKLIDGGNYVDERGELHFFNKFDMSNIKRVYFTKHFDTNVIRAWQGHKIESRWFISIQGSFKVKLIKIKNWEAPKEQLQVLEYTLSDKKPQILFIPNGFVNGFKALEANSKLMIFSDYRINEIENDQVRFDASKWTTWNNQ